MLLSLLVAFFVPARLWQLVVFACAISFIPTFLIVYAAPAADWTTGVAAFFSAAANSFLNLIAAYFGDALGRRVLPYKRP
jgi:hypothetical protein